MLDKDKSIIIATACDNGYVQHTAVFLKSLFEKNLNCKVFIFVPDNFMHHSSFEHNLGSRFSCLEFVKINLAESASLKVSRYISIASYFRLFLDKLIPAHIERVIYLDSDILISGYLDDLWAVDLGNYSIAAVADPWVNTDQAVRGQVGLAPESNYFNAGVLVIDIGRWRSARLGERALNFVVKHPDLITFWDQCALNHVLSGQFKELTKEWNFQTDHLRWTEYPKWTLATLRELDTAKIIHFTGPGKPWHYLNNHPMKWLYWEYLRGTQWRDYRPPDRTGRNVLKKNLEHRAPVLLKAVRSITRSVSSRFSF